MWTLYYYFWWIIISVPLCSLFIHTFIVYSLHFKLSTFIQSYFLFFTASLFTWKDYFLHQKCSLAFSLYSLYSFYTHLFLLLFSFFIFFLIYIHTFIIWHNISNYLHPSNPISQYFINKFSLGTFFFCSLYVSFISALFSPPFVLTYTIFPKNEIRKIHIYVSYYVYILSIFLN